MDSKMRSMISIWNWPNTGIDPVEVNYLAHEIAEHPDHTFSLLEEYSVDNPQSGFINSSLVDLHIRTKKKEIRPSVPRIFLGSPQNIRPSKYVKYTQIGNYTFCDRSHRYPWIWTILKRIKCAVDLADNTYSHLVFVSGGLVPTESGGHKILEMVEEASQKSRDLIIFRDENRNVVPDFFIISKKAGKEIFDSMIFDPDPETPLPFFNYSIEEFLDEISMRYPDSSNISSKILGGIGTWERPTFSLSMEDEKISEWERLHIIDTISVNSPYLTSNRDGSFTLSYLMANLDQSLDMEFAARVILNINKPGQPGDKYLLYEKEGNIRPQESMYGLEISKIYADPNSYLEIQYSVGCKGIYLQENYNIPLDFLSLHSLWGFRQLITNDDPDKPDGEQKI